MEWILLFFLNWIIFLFLVDWKKFTTNMFAGFLAMGMALITDYYNGMIRQRYMIHDAMINIFGSSLFFLLGPCFVIGTLIAQYYPKKRWMAVLNALVITGLYSLTELILVERGVVEYKNWYYFDSLLVNVGAMIIISWFSVTILNKWRC
ncbi:hypothetical protein [Crassaminicella profunda]|uniref:hypothetical protein n=1 Tax=Crassaminicella profunda TaxID=1286698 RepID=UPI001CA74B4C|nr:hypothetical protein [Crassaminicella profunda]QZY54572.1 hypothetical protein K7H06_16250 [Crassaminicella profunda]